MDTMQ